MILLHTNIRFFHSLHNFGIQTLSRKHFNFRSVAPNLIQDGLLTISRYSKDMIFLCHSEVYFCGDKLLFNPGVVALQQKKDFRNFAAWSYLKKNLTKQNLDIRIIIGHFVPAITVSLISTMKMMAIVPPINLLTLLTVLVVDYYTRRTVPRIGGIIKVRGIFSI